MVLAIKNILYTGPLKCNLIHTSLKTATFYRYDGIMGHHVCQDVYKYECHVMM